MRTRTAKTSVSAWAVPPFRRVLAGNVINMVGSAVAPVALAFAVLGQGGGIGSLAVVLALNTVPSVLALLYGGVLADRTSRSRLLLRSRCAAGILQALVAILVLTDHSTPASLGALGFVSGLATTLARPAARGIVRQVVSRDQLQDALALNRLLTNITRVAAPVAGGIAVGATSPGWVLAFDAVTFFLSAVALKGVRLDAPMRSAPTSTWHDLHEGLAAARSRAWFLSATAFGAVIVVFWRIGYELLGPVLSRQSYAGPAAWGLIQGALAGGMVAGGFVSLRWKPLRIGAVAAGAGAALGPLLISLSLSSPIVIVAVAAFLAGIGQDVAIVAWSTVLGQHVDEHLQGRLQSINSIGELAGVPFGYIVVGVLGTSVTPTGMATLAGAGIIVAGIANLGVKSVWTINRISGPVERPASVG